MNVLEMVSAINPIAFEIGGLQVRWYGIIIAFAIYLATTLADKEATRKGYRKEFIIDLVFWAVPLGFVGARLYYILFEWQYYFANPSEIIQIWHGGIAIYGGVIAGAATVYWFAKKEKVSFALLLDILAPVVLLAQAIGRWGNFTNQEAHGEAVTRAFLEGLHLPTFIIEQMHIDGVYYHPTFLYESLWSFVGVLILFYLRRRKGIKVGEIIQIWHGGIAIYGGVIAGAATVYWFAKKEKVSFALLLDILAPVVLLAQAIGRWGNFTNQEAHGEAVTRAFLEGLHLPTFIIEQMHIDGVYYHPTFLYESLWSFVGVLILFYLRRRKGVKVGEIMAGYLLWYSFGRFFIEGMRTDSLWMFGIIRISQLVSIVLFLLGIAIIVVRRRRVPAVPDYVSIDDPQSPVLFGKA